MESAISPVSSSSSLWAERMGSVPSGAPPSGDLPAVLIERETELAYQPGVEIIVQRHYPYRQISKANLSVDAITTGRIDHFVFGDPDPGVKVFFFRGKDFPGIFGLIHGAKVGKICEPGGEGNRIYTSI